MAFYPVQRLLEVFTYSCQTVYKYRWYNWLLVSFRYSSAMIFERVLNESMSTKLTLKNRHHHHLSSSWRSSVYLLAALEMKLLLCCSRRKRCGLGCRSTKRRDEWMVIFLIFPKTKQFHCMWECVTDCGGRKELICAFFNWRGLDNPFSLSSLFQHQWMLVGVTLQIIQELVVNSN